MPDLPPNLFTRLQAMAGEYDDLGRQLLDPAVMQDHQRVRELSVRRAALEDAVAGFRRHAALQQEVEGHRKIIAEHFAAPGSAGGTGVSPVNAALAANRGDAELALLAREELPELEQRLEQSGRKLMQELVAAQDRSVGSVILEIRAGTGGDEAGIWAGDLWEMYRKLADRHGLEFTPLDSSPGDAGGVRWAVASVSGPGVWQTLGYEGGVHCVKRVPATEAQGRIHTSTATVAVLPEPLKVELDIPESDVKIDVTTAQGPGGQNVNKVATAVKMVHMPTGIEVRMQESKSQQQNRARAWQLLRARVFDHHQQQLHAQRRQQRQAMIGSGDRSERIRTYRYKENIAVDHRIEGSFNLSATLDGDLEPILTALANQDLAQRLAAL